MATLKDLHELMARIPGVSRETATLIVAEIQATLPGDKIYVPAHRHCKKEAIIEAARKLPTGIVAERYGVSHSWALRAIKSRKN